MLRLFPLLTLTLCVLSAGCSQMVTVSHKPEAKRSALDGSAEDTRYGLPTKIFIQPKMVAANANQGHMGLLIAGPQVKWKVDLNAALPDAIQAATLKTYREVEISASCSDCGLVFRPEVKRFDIDKLSMQATVEIAVRIYDADHSEITHIEAIGKSPYMDASRLSTGLAGYFIPLFGTAMGKSIITKTARQALDQAIDNFHAQITEQTDSGVLARHWLPKRENRAYDIGKHQFHAERVAIGAGCRIESDEVRLVKQNYFAESFVANCWGQPSFAIDCKYGRCAPRQHHKSLAQN